MGKTQYYFALFILFIVCMMGVILIMASFENLGAIWVNFGYIIGITIFLSIKPFVKKSLIKDDDKKSN